MAKPIKKANRTHQQLRAGLIETKPTSWERKALSKDEEGNEIVNTVKVAHDALRFPLARNVSEENVERAARRWL